MATRNPKNTPAPKKKAAAKKPPARKKIPRAKKAGNSQSAAKARRLLFIEAYLQNGGNAREAALAAGFSAKSAGAQGSRLLQNAKFRQEIDSRRAELNAETKLTTVRVLDNVAQALFFDPRTLFNDDGTLKGPKELDDTAAQAITSLEVFEEYVPDGVVQEPQPNGGTLTRRRRVAIGRTVKVKWLDKNTVREQAMKHLGLFDKDNRQRTDPLAQLLGDLMKRRSALPVVPDEGAGT